MGKCFENRRVPDPSHIIHHKYKSESNQAADSEEIDFEDDKFEGEPSLSLDY